MISFHNIQSIAKYERKTLFRSWFFRIFGVLALLVLFLMNFAMVSEGGNSQWIFRAIPSSIPYFNLLILNVAQAIIAVFLASDFLKRDKKLDTTEVIYMRSMTNGEYVIGKTLGNMQVFMVLNFAILIMALIFNLIAQNTHVPWLSYLLYPLLISIPTLIYIMGLSFLLMILIKNQAVTFVVILGYIGITLFVVKDYYYYLFDYMSFNIPMLRSEITGFGNLETIIAHRGIYLSLGIGCIFLTIFLLKRLPQSETLTWFSLLFGIMFIAGGAYLGYEHVNKFVTIEKQRGQAVMLNDQYAGLPFADARKHHIQLSHTGYTIDVQSKMELINHNRNSLDSLVLNLNPGLEVTAARVNGQTSDFHRRKHLLVVPLTSPMLPNQTLDLEINYAGKINEAYCYLDIDRDMRTEKFGEFIINVDKRHAFITPTYVLLTKEAGWYPETGVTYSQENFGWDRMYFTDFSVEVQTDTTLQAVSQGNLEKKAPGKFSYSSANPLTQISLAIGNYAYKGMEISGIEFGVWHIEGHDFFTNAMPDIQDTIPAILEERLRDFQRTYNLQYPFKRFSIVEVPSQFKSFERTWTQAQGMVQPEQVFIQEKGYLLRDFDFQNQIKQLKRWSQRSGESLSDEDLQIRLLNNIAGNFTRSGGRVNFRMGAGGNFQASETANPYFIFPNLYYFANHIRSTRWPVTNLVMEAYLQSQASDMRAMWMRDISGISEDEMASIALQDRSFEELLQDKRQRNIIDNLIKLKGDVLFTTIQATAGETEFTRFLRGLLRQNQFKVIMFDDFDQMLAEQFDIALSPIMDNWFRETELPQYLFSPVTAINTKSGDQINTMVSFTASNTSNIDGVVKITFRMGGPGGGGRGRMMMRGGPSPSDNVNRILTLSAGETMRVSYLFDQEPRDITINTLISRNLPQTIMQLFGRIEEDLRVQPIEGEFVIEEQVATLQPNEIVVNNEDPGFEVTVSDNTSLLHQWIIKDEDTGLRYSGFNTWRPPLNWTLTTNSSFYGLYVRSAHYIKAGNGDQRATWNLPVTEAGNYDIYTHIAPNVGRGGGGGGGGGRGGGGRGGGGDNRGEYQYFIYNENGITEQSLRINTAEPGWNLLGSFYLSADNSKVVLTNKSTLPTVIADAIKIVKL